MSAASYEARGFGVHSAMSLREAYRRCPDGVFLPVDGRRYQAASRDVMAILRRFTPLVEPISIDEAFLDVTGSAALFGDGPAIARRIKDEVRDEVGLTASVGVATTKLVAKIASDLRKPDGLVVVPPGEEAAFLAPLPIARLWGVGEKTAIALWPSTACGRSATWRRCRRTSSSGGSASTARRSSRGRAGSTPTRSTTATRRSRSATSTRSTSTRATRRSSSGPCSAMAEGVAGRLRSAGVRAGHGRGQDPRQRRSGRSPASGRCAEPTDLTEPIYATALELARPEVRGMRVRLLGVTASNLGEREQLVAVRQRRPAPPAGGRGGRRAPAAVRRADASPGRGCSGAGLPAPFERDPRNPLDRRARGVPAATPTRRAAAGRRRVVTAKVTRTSTRFRPTTLDIEHLFGLR